MIRTSVQATQIASVDPVAWHVLTICTTLYSAYLDTSLSVTTKYTKFQHSAAWLCALVQVQYQYQPSAPHSAHTQSIIDRLIDWRSSTGAGHVLLTGLTKSRINWSIDYRSTDYRCQPSGPHSAHTQSVIYDWLIRGPAPVLAKCYSQ